MTSTLPAVTAAVVADRWPLMRVGLARAAALAGLRVAGEGRDLAESAAMARLHGAGLVVVGDSDESTALAARRLADRLLVVALVRRATRDHLVSLLAAGVAVVSLRSATPEELGGLLRRALAGERAVAPALVPMLAGWSGPGGDALPPVGHPDVALTAKEREVLVALAAGASNQQIAEQLYVTPATVKTHLAHIYGKLGVSGRHEALSRAVALGVVH